jgi:hypothetical protein
LLLPFPSAVKWSTIAFLLLLACFFLVYNKTHKNSSIKNQIPKRKTQMKRLEKQAVWSSFRVWEKNVQQEETTRLLLPSWLLMLLQLGDRRGMASSLAAAGAAWLILPLQNRYWLFYERKKEIKKEKTNQQKISSNNTRLTERQWVPSICVDIYVAVRNIWKAAFCEGKKQYLLFLFIVTITLLLLLLLFFTHHHSTPHRSFACYVSFTPNKLSSWAELNWACFVLPWASVISSVEAPFCLCFQETQFGFVGVCLCVCLCGSFWRTSAGEVQKG